MPVAFAPAASLHARPFLAHPATLCPTRRPLPPSTPRVSVIATATPAQSSQPSQSSDADAHPIAFSGSPGPTGTYIANLFPIPILGAYGWFLTVYNRDLASKNGAFVAQFPDTNVIHLAFRPNSRRLRVNSGERFRAFKGIAMGNINIRNALSALVGNATTVPQHELRLFERGKDEYFFNRRVEVHLLDDSPPPPPSPLWDDIAPTYSIETRAASYEIRTVYPSGGTRIREPAKLEYFAMNLFPIPLLLRYGAFVTVWRQRRNTSPVAIDRRGSELRLAPFDPLELPNDVDPPQNTPVAKFAVKVFFGAVSDDVVALQYRTLLNALAASSRTVRSEMQFRIVVDNRPNTLTPNRRNELWVEVE